MKKKKCPKCKGEIDCYTEWWKDHSIDFYTNVEGNLGEGLLQQTGDPYCVEATCSKCGYKWRLRGVVQITDLTQGISNEI